MPQKACDRHRLQASSSLAALWRLDNMKTLSTRLGLTLVVLALLAAGAAPTEAATRRYTQIATGGEHACAITSRGVAYCWGDNQYGQLGNGDATHTRSTAAVAVAGGYRFVGLAASKFTTCGITSSGRAYCWGADMNDDGYSLATGMLGSGAGASSADAPRAVTGGRRFSSISAGTDHFCGLTSDSRAYCWGGNAYGQLGDGTTVDSAQPTAVLGTTRYVSITTAHIYTCGITVQRGVICWGADRGSAPTMVLGGRSIVRLEATETDLCGLTNVGKLLCLDTNIFKGVAGAPKYSDLAVGSGEVYSLCGLQNNGTVYCWGMASDPMMLETDLRFKSVAQGGLNMPEGVQFSCGLTPSGIAYCWGSNEGGQLGNGTLDYSSDPVAVQ